MSSHSSAGAARMRAGEILLLLLLLLTLATVAFPHQHVQQQHQHVQQRQQQQHVPGRSIMRQHRRRHLLHHEETPEQPERLRQWLQSSNWTKTYTGDSCFPSGTVHNAANMTEWIRLVKDPAVRQIQLTGDIAFSPDLFPHEHSNDRTKGVNVSHNVEMRACAGQEAPIIIDCRDVFRQVYVNGNMTWRGSIKFVNSFPSPRRGGLWALPSPLSIEDAGQIHMQGVQVHGSEPSALFDQHDPYWSVHNDTRFAPQPSNYEVLTPTALIMHHWLYNRTAWLLHSQGANGLVRSTGDGFWLYDDVLITYSPTAPASKPRGWLALAIALPVVLGLLLLAGGVALAWCIRRKRSGPPSPSPGKLGNKPGTQQRSVSFSGPTESLLLTNDANSFTGLSSLLTVDQSPGSATVTKELIEVMRLRMRLTSSLPDGALVLQGQLGEGTFGKVYSAMWKGTLVAVKTMLLPAAMSGKERREKMAIMETAISSSLSHPNIVQTYTYEVKPLTSEPSRKGSKGDELSTGTGLSNGLDTTSDNNSTKSSMDHHGWEVRLVLELCDLGTLQELLVRGGFTRPSGQHDLAGLLATATDVAGAMHHLHTENVIHGDLKARNVLLKSAGGDARGFVAKVSDFGLSMRIDPTETHVSNFYQGTLTHMAPEVLMYGKISFASDVYAFGIMLYEMYTAQQAFEGVLKVLLGHEVTKMGRRPEFPPDCPFDYQLLACRCWESDPAIRPTFGQILAALQQMCKRVQESDAASRLSEGATYSTCSSCSSANPPAAPTPAHLGHPRNAGRLLVAPAAAAACMAAGACSAVVGSTASTPVSPPHHRSVSQGSISTGHGSTGEAPWGRPDAVLLPSSPQLHTQQQQQQQSGVVQLQDAQARRHGGQQLHEVSNLPGEPHQLQGSSKTPGQPGSPPHASMSGAAGAGGSDTAAAAAPAPKVGADSPSSGQQLQPSQSLGTWSGGGVWMSGSLAPVELQQGQDVALLADHNNQQQHPQPQLQRAQQPTGVGVRLLTPAAAAAAAPAASSAAGHSQAPGGRSQAPAAPANGASASLGSWSGGGLWMSGSLEPMEVTQLKQAALGQP